MSGAVDGAAGGAAGGAGDGAASPPVVVTLPDPGEQETGPQGEPLLVVRLLGAPVRLWERASIHTAELVREFSLLTIGMTTGTGGAAGPDAPVAGDVPRRLVELAGALQARYAGITDAQQDELDDALAAGLRTHDLTYRVPASVGQACEQLLALLDEADAYCQHGDLLTLVSPPDQREFRRWYLGEFSRQTAGGAPRRWDGPTD